MRLYQFPAMENALCFQQGKLAGIITQQGRKLLPTSFSADELDLLLKNGMTLKDSPTTTAALVQLPSSDTKFFLKRNNNKGPRFTCRYLFRRARVFHAAKMAEVFEELKIRTPQVYMAAEKKTGLYLHAGYIITQAMTNAKSVLFLLKESNEKEEILQSFLPWAAKKLTQLHRTGIIHGDLKLQNFYCDGDWHDPDNSFGIWDLDSVSIRKSADPQKVDREISRIFFALGLIPDEQGKHWQDTEERCRNFCKLYHDFAPDLYQPELENIMDFINKRIARLRKHPYRGMEKGTF